MVLYGHKNSITLKVEIFVRKQVNIWSCRKITSFYRMNVSYISAIVFDIIP